LRPLVDRERLDKLLSELGRHATEPTRLYLVGGATALLRGWRSATIDVDLRVEPENAALLKSIPALKEELRLNVELASPVDFLPELPGWRDRSRFLRQEGRLAIFEFDLYSQALAKIERGHERDLADVAAMLAEGAIVPDELRRQFAAIEPELYRFPAIDPGAFHEDVERALDAHLAE
jgi:hypothetical protein